MPKEDFETASWQGTKKAINKIMHNNRVNTDAE
jgi:hypothetical protein